MGRPGEGRPVMGYPAAVATGNAVIAAALEWSEAFTTGPYQSERSHRARLALADAVRRHIAETAVAHVQGPDIDADDHTTATQPTRNQ